MTWAIVLMATVSAMAVKPLSDYGWHRNRDLKSSVKENPNREGHVRKALDQLEAALGEGSRGAGGEWGVEIAGAAAPSLRQLQPARLEVFRTEEDIRQLAAGYKTVEASADGFDARAEIACGQNVVFRVQDHWSLNGAVLSVRSEPGRRTTAPSSLVSDFPAP